jgi:hypothetical protein
MKIHAGTRSSLDTHSCSRERGADRWRGFNSDGWE